ncbi:MAG: YpmA family protein [Desulfosporosinus sp.]
MDDQEMKPSTRQGKLELIATQRVSINGELYKIINFLNKSLKDYRLIFGLTKKENKMVISIYEVD